MKRKWMEPPALQQGAETLPDETLGVFCHTRDSRFELFYQSGKISRMASLPPPPDPVLPLLVAISAASDECGMEGG